MTDPRQQIEALNRVKRIAVGHELRMTELEQEVNELCQRHGEALRYARKFEPDLKPGTAEPPPVASRDGLVPLDAVLFTEELTRRSTRSPDYETESRALAMLVEALADSPRTILQTLADTILEVFQVGSAGISLLTRDEKSFVWPAIAGAWQAHIGGGTPRDFGPCGDVLDHNTPLLFKHVERRYAYFLPMTALAEECLLIPFYVKGKAVGTIWAIAHDDRRKFDAEDLRQLETLGRFASAAYQAAESLDAALGLMEDALQSRQALEQLNAQLRESEERYRTLFDSLDQGFCVIEKVEGEAGEPLDFRFVEANPAFAAQSGVSDVVGKTMRQLFPDEPEEWFLTYDAVCRTGEPIRFERELVSQGRVLELYAFRVSDKTPGRVSINFQDITARKQAEDALRESEEFNRSIVKSSPDCIKVLDLEGNLLSMQSGQELLGIEDIQPFLNKSWLDFWTSQEDRSAAQAAVESAAAGGAGNFVGFFRTLHGDAKWWDVAILPILDADGKPARLLAVSREVTQRQQAEEVLRHRTAQFESLLNEAPLGVYLIDADFRIRQVNPTALPAFGNMSDLIGRDFAEVMHILWPSAQADEVIQKFRHTLETGEACFVPEMIEKRADRQTMEYYEWQINRILLPDGRHGVVCYFRDISERVLAQQKIRDSEERYRGLFNSIDEGFAILEIIFDEEEQAVDYRFLEVNPAFGKQTGVPDATGKRIREITPDQQAPAIEIYSQVLLTGEPVRFVNESKALGRYFDVYAIRLGGPESRKIAAVFSNITERKEAEEALRESEERFRAFVMASSDLMCRMSPDWSEMRQVYDKNFVVETEVPNGNWLQNYVYRDDQQQLMAAVNEAIRTKSLFEMEHRVRLADGSWGWMLSRAVPLLDASGEIVEWFGTGSDVTEQKRAQQALRESDERYHSLFNSIDEGFCLIEMIFDEHDKAIDYRFLEVNPAFERQTGMLAATGKRMRELVPDLEEHWFEIYGQVALTGEAIRFVNEAKALGERWFDVYAFPYGRRESCKVALLFNDMTERKKAQEALRESEERYRNLFNSMDEGYCIIDMLFDEHEKPVDYRFLEVNPAFEKQTGMHDVTGKRVREIIPDLEENWFEIYGEVALTGKPVRFINEVSALNSWLDIHAARLGGPQTRQVAVIFDNITERTKSDQALRQSEARFRALFDRGPIAIYSCDCSGRIQEYNACAVKLWGREPKRNSDESFSGSYKLYFPDGTFLAPAQSPMAEVLRGEIPGALDQEFIIERPDGSRITVIANIVPLKNEQRQITGGMCCFYDITERSRLERKTLEQAQALADLDRRKDEFLAMLGHELRNPLAALSNAVLLLRLQKNVEPIQQQSRGIIERQVGQLKHLVDDLLEVSRITTGSVRLRQERISVSGVVERAVETAQPLIAQRRHELKVSLPQQPIFLHADAARLEQVLVNLLNNAAKYSEEGGRIWLSVEQEGAAEGKANEAVSVPMVVIRVRDTGIGIAPELLPRIFDLFTQADRSLDRSQGGLGIGLCLVQRLVELHGGTVEAHSVLGQGSEFVVRLPVMLTALPASPSPATETVQPPAKGCRVLVVDDNVDAAQSLAVLLEMTGHEVWLAYDGPTALKAAIDYRPDVTLLDIGLPGLTGYEVAQQIRQQPALKNIVLVALTGYGQESDLQLSQEAGFDHHLVKPVDFAEVEKILAIVAEQAA